MRAIRLLLGSTLAAAAILALAPGAATADEQGVFRAPAARPTDDPDPNRNSYTAKEAPQSPSCTANFCVHWVAKGPDRPKRADANGTSDGDGIPDYVEQVQEVAEYVYTVENVQLGWRDPKSDGKKGGDVGKVDVYLKQLSGELFGYAAPDPGQADRKHLLPRKLYGYMVIDNDYNSFEFPGTKPSEDLEVTFAHEYAHILQFSYDAYQGAWLAESTATWMEDQVYDEINDYRRYLPRWTKLFNTPLTANSVKSYGSAVWNEWLALRYGQSFTRKVWAGAIHVKPGGFSIASYGRAIKAVDGEDFSRDFARFARDVSEWRTADVFPEGSAYPDVARQGSLPVGGKPEERFLNHTTFQLLRIDAPRGRAVVVRAKVPMGVAYGLALVGRVGGEKNGEVVSELGLRQNGGRMSIQLEDPGRFDRITAVLVNADGSALGFSPRSLDWNYLTDTAPFRVRALLAP